jgi:hypothetical protein
MLDDDVIAALIAAAQDVMTQLAGEDETPELPVLIGALRAELEHRTNLDVVLLETENQE